MKKLVLITTIIFVSIGSTCYYMGMMQGESMASNAFILRSTAFQNGQPIPREYTCDGANVSPQLSWQNIPNGTKSLALIVDDPDAQAVIGKTFVHWMVINIPAEMAELTQGVTIKNIGHAQELLNDYHKVTYGGPCPPDKQHTYYFTLFALSQPIENINFAPPITAEQFRQELRGSILGQAILTGVYTKAS